jgi:hypothetical protein
MKYPLNDQYKNLISPTSLVVVYINEPFVYSFSQTTIYLRIRPMYKLERSTSATCLIEDIKSLGTEFFAANTDTTQNETLSFVAPILWSYCS